MELASKSACFKQVVSRHQRPCMTARHPLAHKPTLRFRHQSILRLPTSQHFIAHRNPSSQYKRSPWTTSRGPSATDDNSASSGTAADAPPEASDGSTQEEDEKTVPPPEGEGVEAVLARGEGIGRSRKRSMSFTERASFDTVDMSTPSDGGMSKDIPWSKGTPFDTPIAAASSVQIPFSEVHLTDSKVHTKLERLWEKVYDQVVLVALLGVWYASNIFFNLYNKQVLQVFPHATTCTFLHLGTASALMFLMWALRIKKAPEVNKRMVNSVTPLSLMHLAGFMTTNMSLGAVNVSLTHTIKSLEPFFTVVLSYFFLGAVPSIPVVVTLIPIVAGVVIASATDLSFNWYGFSTAMASNLAFQSRNVISKKYMVESSVDSLEMGTSAPTLDDVNLFACISILATLLCIVPVLALDGAALLARVSESGLAIMSLDTLGKTLAAGLCRTGDVLSSYALLSRLNPVTHSVGNCVKRVVVIAVSIIFFKTPASMTNIIGTAVALSGVFAYSMAKRIKMKERPKLKLAFQSRSPTWLEKLLITIVPGFLRNIVLPKKKEEVKEKVDQKDEDDPEYAL